ncbi:hypothetical protein PPL_02790 [Heterostelium album PN500]|uniref:MD-2-related lipid-recognition domain-containing protein n=1 Tax=Heterostelium pallidum (strain ATCC 26659 / Pp 5 / PN500) TaxID=670386 RepID=D3B325_HETP5|nr:hypothetical protein PPL_02790 [Heterostelium album PN500]EFA83723.1 hypothetical protein PPL_02790 [Heterostelium album PN500]|eukprot:XP_020435840.1 hypothetical protein PPL_02790 [Heterostelium album PN500]
MKYILLLSVVFVMLSLVRSETEANPSYWSSCAAKGDKLTLKNVVLAPFPPVRGKNLNITVIGTLNEKISNGIVYISMIGDNNQKMDTQVDICKNSFTHASECPAPAGNFAKTISLPVPAMAPPGHYTTHIVVRDDKKNQITCYNLDITLPH